MVKWRGMLTLVGLAPWGQVSQKEVVWDGLDRFSVRVLHKGVGGLVVWSID